MATKKSFVRLHNKTNYLMSCESINNYFKFILILFNLICQLQNKLKGNILKCTEKDLIINQLLL